MPVSLTKIGDALRGGVTLAFKSKDPLHIGPEFPNLKTVSAVIDLRTVGDLQKIPNRIEAGDMLYERKLVFAGREYPQGWGRGPGGAAAEPPPEPDGKVDTFKYEDNENMKALMVERDVLLGQLAK